MSATDERQAFHAAIWRTPDDDLPRLVYADWLDERNEHDAATFLRLLCAVRTCPPDVDRLRPLVADLRRAMVKLPSKWVDDVCPVPPAVVHGFGDVNEPGPPLSIVKLICVPSGALTKPEPSLTFTCAVNVWVCPTRLTPFGVIEMFASTT